MFITEKMHEVTLFLPKEDAARFWDKLGRFGALQPNELRQVDKLQDYLTFVDLGALSTTLRDIANFINLDLTAPMHDPSIKPLNFAVLKERLEEISTEVATERDKFQKARDELRAIDRDLDHLAVYEAHLKLLAPLNIDIGALLSLTRFYVRAGTLFRPDLAALDRSLQRYPHLLVPYHEDQHRVQLIIACLPEDQADVEKILESALFRPIELPANLSGSPQQALEQLGARRQELLQRREEVQGRLAEIEEWRQEKRAQIGDMIKLHASIIAAQETAGQTQEVTVAAGWVPKRELKRLRATVRAEPKWVLATEEFPYERVADAHGFSVPSELRNPSFFRTFEGLVRLYGTPRYGGFDPTLLFTLSYVVMFGMMFGDLGHGFILFLSGLLLRLWPRLRMGMKRTGTILITIGLSSMLFGTLYGSVFGYDNIIPALWFRPFDHINQLLIYAIILGAAVIILGILVNIMSKIIQHRYIESFFARFGFVGLWFYLGLLLTMYLSTKGGMGLGLIIGLMLLPLVLMALEKPVSHWAHTGKSSAPEGEKEGLFVGLIVTGVDLFETMIVYFSNSLSFIRVAAFALNHVALSVAFFQMGAMLRGLPAGGAFYLLTIAGGNILILVLEGGIVAIQALRLEFYEFFSKFFEAEGTAFQPFKLEFRRR